VTEVSAGTLTDFLLARISDDERVARIRLTASMVDGLPTPEQQRRIDATYIAQRGKLSAESQRFRVEFLSSFPWRWFGRAWLKKLAQPYATHDDFRPEWRL
jgi:hypothetical protein